MLHSIRFHLFLTPGEENLSGLKNILFYFSVCLQKQAKNTLPEIQTRTEMKKLLFSLISCSITVLASTQVHEKIYLQTDRDLYRAGETIYFKGVVITDMDSVASTVLYVELWDDSLTKQAGQYFPVIEGTSSGSLNIPVSAKGKRMVLRAYTEISATQSRPFQFIKPVVYSRFKSGTQVLPVFYPEGGKLVSQALNHITFSAAAGFNGILRSEKGDSIVAIRAAESGLGSFSFIPQSGEKYAVFWETDGETKSVALQQPVNEGTAIHLNITPDTLYFTLDNGANIAANLKQLKVQLMNGQDTLYQVDIKMNKQASFSYFIPLNEFHTALTAFRVMDNSGQVIASRPVFISRHSIATGNTISPIQFNMEKRAENLLSIELTDTTLQHIAVSITDADSVITDPHSDIFSVVGSSGSYPLKNAPADFKTLNEFDQWIQLAGFNKNEISNVSTGPGGTYKSGYLQLKGTVKKSAKKPLAEKKLLVGVRSDYTGKELYKVVTDKEGEFVLDGVVAYGDTYVHCRMPGKEYEELICTYSLSGPELIPAKEFQESFKQEVSGLFASQSVSHPEAMLTIDEPPVIYAGKVITLEEVQLRSNSRMAEDKRKAEVDEKYVGTTPFGGYFATGEMVDVLNDPTSIKYTDIYSYIRARMIRVGVRYIGGIRQLVYFGRGATGEMPISLFYIDNAEVLQSQIEGLNLDQVAAIKFVPNFVLRPGLPPAIAIFLRKPGDKGYWEKDKFQIYEQKIEGYPVYNRYTMPDYTDKEVNVERDTRKTLFWDPYVSVQKGVATLRFFNNDFTKRVRVVVEGQSADGSIVRFEKLLE